MNEVRTTEPKPRQVFMSYAAADKAVARIVAEALQNAGLNVKINAWALEPGDSIAQRVQQAVLSSDILVVLLSPRAVASSWVQTEFNAAISRELRDRAITVIPALIEDCDIPPSLARWTYVDLRRDIPGAVLRLINQIRAAPEVDFSRLDSKTFERMVEDLLAKLGFSVLRGGITHDSGVDIIATFHSRDPFGAEQTETWLVEAKLYRDQRVSVSALHQMLGFLMTSGGTKRGLIITNSRLNSVARSFLSESIGKTFYQLRVIDGTELTDLLIQHPDLIQTYFTSSGVHE